MRVSRGVTDMKKILSIFKLTLWTSTVLVWLIACGEGGSSRPNTSKPATDPAGIPAAVVGAWAIESMSAHGHTIKATRPSPLNPYAKTNPQDFLELLITEKEFTLISSTAADFTELKSAYSIDGRNLITVDTANSIRGDFAVVSYSQATLTLRPLSGANPPNMTWTFRRIRESDFANQSSPSLTFTQKLSAHLTKNAHETMINKSIQGLADVSVPGIKESISCTYRQDKNNLSLRLYQFRVSSEGTISASSEDEYFDFEIKNLSLNLSGIEQDQDFTLNGKIVSSMTGPSSAEEPLKCALSLSRQGVSLEIEAACGSADRQFKAEISATCLLRVLR